MKKLFFFALSLLIGQASFAQSRPTPPVAPRYSAISVELASPLFRHITAGYETELSPNLSWQTKLGIIYSGENVINSNKNFQQYGAFLRTGIKFLRAFSPYYDNERSRHPLEGSYIKPEIVLGYFNEADASSTNRYRNNTIAGAVMVNFGKQYAFGDRLLVYYDFGVGYAFSNENMTRINNGDKYRPYGWYYSHFGTPNAQVPIAFSASFGIGYIFAR